MISASDLEPEMYIVYTHSINGAVIRGRIRAILDGHRIMFYPEDFTYNGQSENACEGWHKNYMLNIKLVTDIGTDLGV